MEQIQTPRTTATSQSEGRLKVSTGSSLSERKKNFVKNAVKKYRKKVVK